MLPNIILTNFAAACQPAGARIIPTWYKYLDGQIVAGKCTPMIDFTNNPENIVKVLLAIFEILLFVGGAAAIGFIMYGGFQYLISQGEPERTKAAKSTVLNAIIGLAISMSAVAIVNLIGNNLR
jgi:hypothetical protein